MKEFNIGDKVWWAKVETKQVTKICPVCFGHLNVIVILGDGTQVKTPCDYCGKGFEGPRGFVNEYEWVNGVELVTIDGKEVSESNGKRDVEYRLGNYCLYTTDIFEEKHKAILRVTEKIKEHELEEIKRDAWKKDNKVKSFSWSVGYYRREIKRKKEEIERYEKLASICKTLLKD